MGCRETIERHSTER